MNCLTVDGTNLSIGEVTGANLDEILINLMEHPYVINRTITKVMVNGAPYSEEVPHAALEVERNQIDSLELITHSESEMGLHFLEHGHFFTNTLRQAIPKIVENFRLGDEVEANEHFLIFLEPLHLLITMLDHTKISVGFDDQMELGKMGTFDSFMIRLMETLTQLASLQEQSDWVYMADILEYDVDALLGELAEMMPFLKQVDH